MAKFKKDDRVRLMVDQKDSDKGQIGTVLKYGDISGIVWVQFDTPTRYPIEATLESKAGYCDSVPEEDLELIEETKKETMAKTKFIDTTKMSSGEEKVAKPIEFTEYMSRITGWVPSSSKPSDYAEVKYLGKCERDGDKFAATSDDGVISIYKGHLNDGFIED